MSSHRVVLVREWDSQHTGSGCCGRLGGLDSEVGAAADYAHNRCRMEEMGSVYRALRREFSDDDVVDIQIVDPRNTAWLLPAIWRDARRHGCSRSQAWRSVCAATAPSAVICDGNVLFSGDTPTPDEAVDAVLDALANDVPPGHTA